MAQQVDARGRSGLAIAGLVLGIIALLTSFLPIINNGSFFLALVGAVLAIIGMVGCLRGTRAGKALAIVAVVLNIVAIALVLASQSAYSSAIDDAVNGPKATATEDASASDGGAAASAADGSGAAAEAADAQAGAQDLAVGATAKLENGVSVTVDSLQPGLTNYDGSTLLGVHVTYRNEGSEPQSYNSYDWKGEDAQGAQTDYEYYSEAGNDQLEYGSIAPGGTVSGMVYLKGDTARVLYFSSMLSKSAVARWNVA